MNFFKVNDHITPILENQIEKYIIINNYVYTKDYRDPQRQVGENLRFFVIRETDLKQITNDKSRSKR